MLLRHINDTQCGFKLANTHAAQHLFNNMMIFKQASPQASGWVVAAWDVEFLFLAQKYGYNTVEVKVVWTDRDQSTTKNRSMAKFAKESWDMLKQVTRVKTNDLTGKYGK
jgi:hypothetical protein